MDPTVLITLGFGGLAVAAAVGAGMHRTLLARRQTWFANVRRALAAQGFDVEPIEQRVAASGTADVVMTAALIATDAPARARVHIAPTLRGAVATIVVRGVKAAANATFSVRRERVLGRWARRLGVVDVEIGDPAGRRTTRPRS